MRKRSVASNNRIEQAVKLRAMGHSYEQIAVRCGYSGRQSAQKAVSRELQRRVSTNVDELRTLQHLALEEIMRLLWNQLYTKKGVVNLRVVDRLIRCYEREAKLYGLDAPRVPRGDTPPGGVKHVVIIREVEASYETWLEGQQERKGP